MHARTLKMNGFNTNGLNGAVALRKRTHLLRRLSLSGVALLSLAGTAVAGPEGAQVVQGNVSIQQSGALTTITASHNSIINYSSFNVGQSETVRFIQPGAASRVLNRITSDAPTYINGNIQANGQVFFVNRAGIFFGPNSVINVGQLFAAAGSISDRDFTAGRLHFSDLRGVVENRGRIEAQGVALLGQAVANHGSITGLETSVIMAAGDEVFLRESSRGGGLMVRVNTNAGSEASTTGKVGIENTGTITTNGGRISMVSGDVYSLAIRNTGRLSGRNISIDGGAGQVHVSGTVDASNAQAGQRGGNIDITGRVVVLDGATVSADGSAGGGEINIGGNFRGQGPLDRAEVTAISRDSVISANATDQGDGGRVAIWSDKFTWFGGTLSARGAGTGNGGFAEVSSADKMVFDARLIDMSSPGGLRGQLLLDPSTLTLVAAAGTLDANLPNILAATGGAVPGSVTLTAINASLLTTDVVLEASDLVTLENLAANFTFTNLVGGRTLTLRTTAANGSITFADTSDALIGAGGAFVLNTGTGGVNVGLLNTGSVSITTTGNVAIAGSNTGGLGFTSSGVNFNSTGVIDTGAGNIGLTHTGTVQTVGLVTNGGNIAVSGTTYTQNAGFLRTGAAFPAVTGSITLNMTGAVTVGIGVNTDVLRVAASGGINLTAGTSANTAAFINTTSGNILVNGANAFGTIAGSNSAAGGNFEVFSGPFGGGALALTVGTVPALVGFNGGNAVNGLSASNGLVTLINTNGGIAVTQALSAGTGAAGVLRLSSVDGVTQSGAGTITANALAVSNTTAGNVDLQLTGNNVQNLAISNTFATGSANLVAGNALTIGTVPASGGTLAFGALSGVSTLGGGSVYLQSGPTAGQNLTITQPVNAAGASIVRLGSTGTITQSGAGTITAATLGMFTGTASAGSVLLTLNNSVGVIAGRIQTNGQSFRLVSSVPLTVGSVAAGPATFNAGGALNGIQSAGNLAGGDVMLVSGGAGTSLAINQPINAPGATVRLQSNSGIGQGGAGLITASALALVNNTAGDILVDAQNCAVSVFAARNNVNGGEIIFGDVDGLTIGTIATSPAQFNAGNDVVGVATSGNGNITVFTEDFGGGFATLTINDAVNAGTGIVRLGAEGGMTQGANGNITAGRLAALNLTFGDIVLLNAGNAFTQLAARNTAASSVMSFRTGGALTITTETNAGSIFNAGAAMTGVVGQTAHTINIISGPGGALAVNQPINANIGGAGALGTVRLSSQGGISQAAAGIITAQNLGVLNATAGNIDLITADNVLSNFAANNTFAGGTLRLRSTNGLSVGTIANTLAEFNGGTDLSGITTAGNGDVELLNTSGANQLTITQAVGIGTGTLRLSSQAGIQQTGVGTITAGTVGAVNANTGGIVLLLNNAVSNFSASNTVPVGVVQFISNSPLTIGTLAGNPATFNAGANLVGVTTNGASIVLASGAGGPLAINASISNGGTAPVALRSRGGITQTVGINAQTLLFDNSVAGNVVLDSTDNTFQNIAGLNTFAGGSVTIAGAGPFTVTNGTDPVLNSGNAINGITTAGNGDVLLNSLNTIAVNDVIGAGTGTVRLQSNGGITQNAAGIITAGALGAVNRSAAGGDIVLDQSNLLAGAGGTPGTFAAFNANTNATSIQFRNTGAFTVGTVTAVANQFGTPPGPFTDVIGVNTVAGNGDVTLVSNNGGIQLAQALNAGTGIARLSAGGVGVNGLAIGQAAAGIITSSSLAIRNTSAAGVTLTQANTFGTLAISSTGAGATQISSPAALTIGQVAAGPAFFNGGAAVTGISSLGNTQISVTNAGQNLIIDQDVSSSLGFVFDTNAGQINITGGTPRTIASTGGIIVFRDAVSLQTASTVVNAGAGRVNFQSTVAGDAAGRNLSIFTTNTPTFNAAAGSIFPSITFGGDVGTVANPLGTLILGGSAPATPRTGVPEYSTIVFAANPNIDGTVPSGVNTAGTFQVFSGTFTMQQGEKLASFGNLTLNNTGVASIGDINVIGTFAVPTGTVNLINRNAGTFRTALGLVGNDGGSDLVANTINITNAFTVNGGGADSTFFLTRVSTSTGTGTFAGAPQTTRTLTSPVALATFVNGAVAVPLDLEAGGRTPTDPSSALAGIVADEAVQRTDPSQTVSAATRDFLRQLKIDVRDVGPDELASFLNGSAFYNDVNSLSSGVSVRRISPIAADMLREQWVKLAIEPVAVLDENGKPMMDASGQPMTQPRQEQVRLLLDQAFLDFGNQAGSSADTSPAVFESFLNSTPKHAQAATMLREIRSFVKNLNTIGLTKFELVRPREELLRILRPESIPFEYFRDLVMSEQPQTAMR